MARIVLVAFDGAQSLDLFGPAEVFAGVRRHLGLEGSDVVVAAVGGGGIRTTCGVPIVARDLERVRPRASDTVLVVGGEETAVRAAVGSRALVAWVSRAARVVRRIGSVCSGAFVLAQAGVLDGRRAATHWSACAQLASFRPQVSVDANAIFVQDGNVWTSAGVTTGIDMVLAMVQEDHGRRVADAIAARLVLYARRPGFQSQFSDALVAQIEGSDPLGSTIAWARSNLRGALDAARLARRAGMSLRTLHRRCAEQLGTTPAKLIEGLRLEQARTLLATTGLGTKAVAASCGFGSARRMARAFERTLGVAPREYAMLHGR
ncbi:MAG TPA: DJ-1/PfpI family protein [Polyangiaceae bacterium]|nr:DJ-1/PfpI family protein [Polyangiaceae bacterium]